MKTVKILCLTVVLTWAASDCAADTWQKLRGQMQGIRSIRADFVQEKTLKILQNPLISKGIFLFKAPDMIRWEYKSPVRVVSLVHGDTVRRYVFTEAGKWVPDSSNSLQAIRMVMHRIIGWLTGRFNQDAMFEATYRAGPPARVVLTPKDRHLSAIISGVDLVFSDIPGVLREIVIREGADNTTRIRFENVRLNKPIPNTRFRVVQ